MDMMMPKMDGLTACHMIKNDPATKSIPVIMVTAIGFELNVKLSQQMGASGYVTKPFSSEDLLGKILQGSPRYNCYLVPLLELSQPGKQYRWYAWWGSNPRPQPSQGRALSKLSYKRKK